MGAPPFFSGWSKYAIVKALRLRLVSCVSYFCRDMANKLGTHARCVFALRHMGHCKGKDNVKKRAKRRMKTERLALAKSKVAPVAK